MSAQESITSSKNKARATNTSDQNHTPKKMIGA